MAGGHAPSADDPLVFNVAGLLAEPPGSRRSFEVSGPVLDLGPDLRQLAPLAGSVRLARTNRGLLVTGDLSTSLAGACSRCLREIEIPLSLALDEEALPTIDIASGMPIDQSADPDALLLTDHHELALEQPIRELILLAEPIAPLCRPDCPGLCPICGEELAGGPHDHPDADVDPRLEALRAFRGDGDPKND